MEVRRPRPRRQLGVRGSRRARKPRRPLLPSAHGATAAARRMRRPGRQAATRRVERDDHIYGRTPVCDGPHPLDARHGRPQPRARIQIPTAARSSQSTPLRHSWPILPHHPHDRGGTRREHRSIRRIHGPGSVDRRVQGRRRAALTRKRLQVERLAPASDLTPSSDLDWNAQTAPSSATLAPPALRPGAGRYANGTLTGTISFYCPNEQRSFPC